MGRQLRHADIGQALLARHAASRHSSPHFSPSGCDDAVDPPAAGVHDDAHARGAPGPASSSSSCRILPARRSLRGACRRLFVSNVRGLRTRTATRRQLGGRGYGRPFASATPSRGRPVRAAARRRSAAGPRAAGCQSAMIRSGRVEQIGHRAVRRGARVRHAVSTRRWRRARRDLPCRRAIARWCRARASCDCVLGDRTVSRFHCEITVREGRACVCGDPQSSRRRHARRRRTRCFEAFLWTTGARPHTSGRPRCASPPRRPR